MGNLVVSRNSLRADFLNKMAEGERVNVQHPVDIVQASFGAGIPKTGTVVDDTILSVLNKVKSTHRGMAISFSGKYNNGLDFVFGGRGSVRERIMKGSFSVGNTLNDNWNDLYDAIRFDLTLRKQARPTIREFIYNVMDMPNASKDVRPTELFPYGFVFEENNGEGQSVRQGQNLGGQYDTIPMKIYAAGFTKTLLATLFDNTYDLQRINDGIALAYSAKQDDLAIEPILSYNYGVAGTAKHTAASTTGNLRQEKLLNTLMNAIDDFGKRTDPVTKRRLVPDNLIVLADPTDAWHIEHVISGLGNSTPEKYTPLRQIKRVVAYADEVIDLPNKSVTYTGCTAGTIHLVQRNRYFAIPIKRRLTMEVDMQPDVSTLSQEQRAWYFVEAMYNSLGIANYVQKVTLPAWT